MRTIKTEQGERKYTVYVPRVTTARRFTRSILFLHGAGERGRMASCRCRGGSARRSCNRPGGLPAIVVFPQARESWAADSADSKAALPALADVMTAYATDPKRVVLTGLSMGGRGSWELAAAHPEQVRRGRADLRPGPADEASRIRGLPVWTFCGDADRDETVLDLRAMVEALEREGSHARLTEYRGVGHNSWDRAYNDPELIEWMLAQRKP